MGHHSSRWSALLASVLLLLYPWGNTLAIAGNFSPVDVAAALAFVVIVLHRAWLSRLFLLMTRTSFGLAVLLLSVMLAGTIFVRYESHDSLLMLSQLLFSWAVVVPTVAVLVASSRDPVAVAYRIGVFYVALFIFGAAAVAFFGFDRLVYFSGTMRLFAVWDGMAFWWMAALAPPLVGLVHGRRMRLVEGAVVLLSCFTVFAIASRALILSLLVAGAYVAFLLVKDGRRRLLGLLGATAGLGALAALLANRDVLATLGLAQRYSGDKIMMDDIRDRMYWSAIQEWGDSPRSFLFGEGSQFHIDGQVIHNVFLQIAVFAGVIALAGLVVLLVSPFSISGMTRRALRTEPIAVHHVRVSLLMLAPWLMTHPLQTSRWYWAYFGAILGVALHVYLTRERRAREVSAAAFSGLPGLTQDRSMVPS